MPDPVVVEAQPQVDASPPPAPAAEAVATPAGPAPAPVAPVAPPAPTPVAVAPASPADIPPEARAYTESLERQIQAAEDQRAGQEYAAQLAQQLEADGLTAEQAQAVAKRQMAAAYRQYQMLQARQQQVATAFEVARQHQVDPQILVNLPDRNAMLAAVNTAKAQTAAAAELAALRAENAELKKKLVPAQPFASAAVGPNGSAITRDNIDSLYRQDPIRYEAAYRRFIRTGQLS